jgi:hypothetical protein
VNKATFLARVSALALALLPAACGPWQEIREAFDPDLLPPVLLGVRVADARRLEMSFDEEVRSPPDSLRIVPELPVLAAEASGAVLTVTVAEQLPGSRYTLEATVSDLQGNSLSFLAEFYGYNPEVPALRINEFTTRGSGNHPDLVELAVLGGGDMGGVVLYQGTPSNYDDRLVFPRFRVAAGQFILVHFRPEGLAEEIDETADPSLSGGCDAAAGAFDFWVPGGTGLSGNNGALGLYACPGGPILDGVLYSNRTAASDELYGGFGTRDAWERARELVGDGGWCAAAGEVRPEDSVSPEGSTGTRSICRDAASTDTDTAVDWHIVPTLGFTFGAANSEEVYSSN